MRDALPIASPSLAPRAGRAISAFTGGRLAPLGLALLATSAWSWASPALACKCMMQAPAQSFEQAVAVFEGYVVEIREPDPGQRGASAQRHVRMQVARAWKGMESEQAEVGTASASEACGYSFRVGQGYLVYASAADGQLRVSSCSRTRILAEADEDIRLLGMGATPVDPKTPNPLGASAEKARAQPEPVRPHGCASCSVAAGGEGASGACVLAILGATIGWRSQRRNRRHARKTRPAANSATCRRKSESRS